MSETRLNVRYNSRFVASKPKIPARAILKKPSPRDNTVRIPPESSEIRIETGTMLQSSPDLKLTDKFVSLDIAHALKLEGSSIYESKEFDFERLNLGERKIPIITSKLPIMKSFSKNIKNGSNQDSHIGFADLPNQIFRHYFVKGLDFNLIVVGESGLGKSTFINNLFSAELYNQQSYTDKTPPILKQTMSIQSSSFTISENHTNLNLTLIDTPGFGDGIDNSTCWNVISSYIDSKYDEYMKWEQSLNRTRVRDMRVHVCLYFISPTGHCLKPLDIEFLKKLHEHVNIVPLIAKSDTLSKPDLIQFKKRIIDDLKINGIKIYEFPNACPQEEEDRDIVKSLIDRIPFAIVSSSHVAEINGKPVRIRKYPWGICEIDNLDHSDFLAFRDILIRTSLCHLVETTNYIFYERYRNSKLGSSDGSSDCGLLESVEAEKDTQEKRYQNAIKMYEQLKNTKIAEFQKLRDEYELELKKKNASVDISGINDKDITTCEESRSLGKAEESSHKKKSSKKKLF